MSKSIYVAGPMTHRPSFNFPAFDAAAVELVPDGWSVINPADHDRSNGFDPTGMTGEEDLSALGFSLKDALLWDLEQVANADAIYLLRGWEFSKGAKAEFALAQALGKEYILQPQLPELPRLIGLGGKLGSGKDEVADELCRAHGYVKIGMSDILNHALLALDPWVEYYREDEPERYSEYIKRHGYVEAKKNSEVRRLLQVLGTEVGRNMLGENIWVDATEARIYDFWARDKGVIVTGIRYPNELEMINALGGLSAWVSRPGHEATGSHASETSVNPEHFGQIILNDGSLEDLYDKARCLSSV